MPTMPPPEQTRTSAPIRKSVWAGLRDLFSIRYHIRRLGEDVAATKAALARRKALHDGEATEEELPDIFRGKLMGVFFATGWTNLLGIMAGGFLQYRFGNGLLGLYATPPLCFSFTAVAFQIGWWFENKKLYHSVEGTPGGRFLALERDMFPVHRASLPIAIGFSLMNYVILSPLYLLLEFINPMLAKNTPAGALIMVVEFLFIGGTFVRLMGDFFDRHGYTLAAKYRDQCVGS